MLRPVCIVGTVSDKPEKIFPFMSSSNNNGLMEAYIICQLWRMCVSIHSANRIKILNGSTPGNRFFLYKIYPVVVYHIKS